MKLTTKGRYAVTAMMDLALNAKLECIALADVAERQGISLAYLEQLFASLRKQGLVVSVRGAKGGYQLAKSAKDITLANILIAVDETINFTCGGGLNCQEHQPCLTHNLWSNLSQELFEFFNQKTLHNIVQTEHVQTMATMQNIHNIGDIPITLKS